MATLVFNYSEEKIEKIDKIAKEEGRTRSGVIQKILKEYLDNKGIKPPQDKKEEIKKRKKKKKKVILKRK